MAREHVDAALLTLTAQFRKRKPNAVAWYKGDDNHEWWSLHMPESDGSIDAADYPCLNGVTMADLDRLAADLIGSRDERLHELILRDQYLCTTGPDAWKWVKYRGKYHGHLHVAVNDKRPNDGREWEIDGMDAKTFLNTDGVIANPSWRPDAQTNPHISPKWAFQISMDQARSANVNAAAAARDAREAKAAVERLAAAPAASVAIDYGRLAAAIVDQLVAKAAGR